MKTNKFDNITLIIDSNGARIIIGLKSNGKVHSGAFPKNEPQPMVHQTEYQLDEKQFKEIIGQFEEWNPFLLQDEYTGKSSDKSIELVFSLGKSSKQIRISADNASIKPIPEKLQKLIILLEKLSKW